ncbi:acyl-CoA dehydrogenase family protein [Rhodococcus opacus]|uniref:acyl-CoA dehydrogenase family protein n=1 Tax=Rhodococcus opacus TaxID=37919 RepID=UPI0029537A7C|nr:acyl-CoA dehydrogenase family protein [Rhodococcus opacus]MDV7089128.1 acyl-CoA dehydrogenase family protein [Rhodococcus opacus]
MIDLSLTEGERALVVAARESANKLFPRHKSLEASRAGRAVDLASVSWRESARLGWFGLTMAESVGGLQMRLVDEVLVLMELGRQAVPGPIIGTILAARLAKPTLAELTMEFIQGESVAAVLVDGMVSGAGAGDYAISFEGRQPTLLRIISAETVEGADDSVMTSRVLESEEIMQGNSSLDQTRGLLVSAYLVGIAESMTAMSAEYACAREQFGVPIGSFQAVKHRCAEMAIRAHVARAQLLVAALLAESNAGGTVVEANAALLLSIEAARRNAEDNVQNHGGIGFTAEHAAGLLVKRVHTSIAQAPHLDVLEPLLLSPRTTLG